MATKAKDRDTNRRVDFPEIGAGVYLRLTNAGVRELQIKFGREHLKAVQDSFIIADIEVLEFLLGLCTFKGGEKITTKFDDIDNISLQLLTDRLRDAWSLAIHGMTFEEQVAHLQKLLEEAKGDEAAKNPLPTSPVDGSATSSEQPSGQA